MSGSNQNHLKALLIGEGHSLFWNVPHLLARAGFQVDVLTLSHILKNSKFIHHCEIVPKGQSFEDVISQKTLSDYDWIILSHDAMLSSILHSNLSPSKKLELLPVLSEQNYSHLYSKIGLSQTLARHHIKTPPFDVVTSCAEAMVKADQLGYPVLLKKDASGGGSGIFECQSAHDFAKIPSNLFDKPMLIQKMMEGDEVDVSAIFLEGQLIHCHYAKVEGVIKKFGPSWLRRYTPLTSVDKNLFDELAAIGKALGAHGMSNISCLETKDGRFYIEVDMRPNVWADVTRFFGDDPAPRIQKWFLHRETLAVPAQQNGTAAETILIPYFLRMRRRDLLLNRQRVWKYIPFEDTKLVTRLLIRYLLLTSLKSKILRFLTAILPSKHHHLLNKTRLRQKFGFLAKFI